MILLKVSVRLYYGSYMRTFYDLNRYKLSKTFKNDKHHFYRMPSSKLSFLNLKRQPQHGIEVLFLSKHSIKIIRAEFNFLNQLF